MVGRTKQHMVYAQAPETSAHHLNYKGGCK